MLQRLVVINANVGDCSHSLDADQDHNYCTMKKEKEKAATAFCHESSWVEMSSLGETPLSKGSSFEFAAC